MWNDFRVGFSLASSTIRRGNKKTLILTVSILTLIFVNLIFLPSMMNGMTDIFTDSVTEYVYGDITIEPIPEQRYINDVGSLLKKIESIDGISAFSKRLTAGATLSYQEKVAGASILGVFPEQETSVSKFSDVMKEGEFLSEMSRNEIVLGAYVSGEEEGPELLKGLGGVTIGKIINVTYSNGVSRQYKIKGIFKAGQEISDTVALVHFSELESVLGVSGQDKASNVIIKTIKEGQEPLIKQELIDIGVKEKIETWQEKVQDIIQDALASFDTLTIISKIVSVIIAVFVLFIIIYISVLNRRKQIGILKAIGITSQSIVISYVILSIFYTILGIILGSILTMLLIYYFTLNPINFYESMYLVPKVQVSVIVQGVISLLATSILAGLVPSWLAVKEPILKSIWGR